MLSKTRNDEVLILYPQDSANKMQPDKQYDGYPLEKSIWVEMWITLLCAANELRPDKQYT